MSILVYNNCIICPLKLILYHLKDRDLYFCGQARIVELFGSCGEYLVTLTAEYIDDFEDCAVYMADCNVKPSRELLIKVSGSPFSVRRNLSVR